MKHIFIIFALFCSLLSFSQDDTNPNVALLKKAIARDRKKYESDLDKKYQTAAEFDEAERIYLKNPNVSSGVEVKDQIAIFPNGQRYPLSNSGVEFISCKISKDSQNIIYDSVLRISDSDGVPYLVRLPLDP